jgi:RNA polymerase sigma-70 factor (ECF subfamily)
MDTDEKTARADQERVFSVADCEPDENQLVRASQAGDQQAFARLVQRYQRRIFNLSLRLVRDYDEASEVTQEAFVAAWQGLPGFRSEAQFSTWLHHIAYHCAMRQIERQKREIALQEAMAAEQRLRTSNEEKPLEDMIEKHEQQVLLRLSLEQLPAHYRLILVLRDFQEMTYQEMADRLALPIGTVKTHIFRARHLLKQCVLALALESQP